METSESEERNNSKSRSPDASNEGMYDFMPASSSRGNRREKERRVRREKSVAIGGTKIEG